MQGECGDGKILRIDGASRDYRSGRKTVAALSKTDLTFMPGEVTVLCGRSGSGKTTLLNLAGLLDRPSGGRIVFMGTDTQRLSDRDLALMRRGNLGYVLQDSGVVERMTALDNVALPGFFSGLSIAGSRELSQEALNVVELGNKAHRLVGQLSGGERMRVGLARALVLSPKLVICDEPTASLDAETAMMVVERLRRAAEDGACILAASHDPIIIEHADRIVTLTAGRVGSDTCPEAGAGS